MRWNYLLPRFTIAAIIWFFFAFAFDPLVRSSLVSLGQKVTGTKVDVFSLQTGFFPPSIKTGPVTIASHSNEQRNLVRFDQIEMKIAGRPLMHRNLIVEEVTVSGMEFDTPRTTSGKLSETTPDQSETRFHFDTNPFRKTSKELGKSWLSSLTSSLTEQLDPNRLETVRVSKIVQQEWKQRFAQYETRLQQIKLEADSVQNKVKTAGGKTLNKIKTYAQSAERVDELIKEGKQIRNELKLLPQIAQQDYQRIEEAKERDLTNIDQMLESISPDPHKILHALLGEELSRQLNQVSGWSNMILQTVRTLQDEQEPDRSQGEWIDFRSDTSLPQVLFKKIRLTGAARVNQQKYPFVGMIKDLSCSPKLYQEPIKIQAQVDAEANIKMAGDLNFYQESPTHEFVVLVKLPHQKKITLEDSETLSLFLIADQTECKSHISFREEDFQCRLEFKQTPVRFQLSSPKFNHHAIGSILQHSLASIDSISATLNYSGSYEHPELKIESELGQKIAESLNMALESEFNRQKQEKALKIEQLASQEREKLIQKLNGQYSEIIAHLQEQESKVQAVIQKVSNRPLDIRQLLR